MKLLRFGQATPLTRKDYLKIRAGFLNDQHRLFCDIAWFTAERPTAILSLGVTDVYQDARRRSLQRKITYKGHTRKTGDTRQVAISSDLRLRLQAIAPPAGGWLFPSTINPYNHLSLRAMDRAFRRAVERAGLGGLGYSLYSFRRGALTELRRRGFDLRQIQAFSGHKSLASLARYLEIPDAEVTDMVEAL